MAIVTISYSDRKINEKCIGVLTNLFAFCKATKQLATILGTDLTEEEFEFKKAVAMAQHHDGVTGTEKQAVTSDYSLYLQDGITYGQKIFTKIFRCAMPEPQ